MPYCFVAVRASDDAVNWRIFPLYQPGSEAATLCKDICTQLALFAGLQDFATLYYNATGLDPQVTLNGRPDESWDILKPRDPLPAVGPRLLHFLCIFETPQSVTPDVHPDEEAHNNAVKYGRSAPPASELSRNPASFMSEQMSRPIFNGRGSARHGPPIVAYHPVFCELKKNLDNLDSLPRDQLNYASAGQLCISAADIYPDETERENATTRHFTQLFQVDGPRDTLQVEKLLSMSSEKNIRLGESVYGLVTRLTESPSTPAFISLWDYKNELGMSGSGVVQVGYTYEKLVSHEDYHSLLQVSSCPCILLSMTGPYLFIFAAVFVDICIVQPLTAPLLLGGSPLSHREVETVAAVCFALKTAFADLQQYYCRLCQAIQPIRSRLYPPLDAILRLGDQLSICEHFVFGDNRSAGLFKGLYQNKSVLVKLCHSYNADAHKLLASHGLAPQLFLCETLPGGICVVIMEYVSLSVGQNAEAVYGQRQVIPSDVLADVRRALDILHDSSYVFGDLRRPNIMVLSRPLAQLASGTSIPDDVEGNSTRQYGVLIDFDRVKKEDEPDAIYSGLLNYQLTWADGVGPGKPMKMEHDDQMLELLNEL